MLKNYILILFVVLLTISCNKTINTNVKKPNVIFVLADDLGYAELILMEILLMKLLIWTNLQITDCVLQTLMFQHQFVHPLELV